MNDNTRQASRHEVRQLTRLCLLTVAILLGAELLGRFVVPRISTIERHVNEDRAATFARAYQPPARPWLLVTGNSLMRSALDVGAMRRQLPAYDVQPYIFESTQYLDWYFGLQHLFESGVRPTAVTIMLNPRQLLSNQLRGTYSALQLFSGVGSLQAGMKAGLHRTEVANLVVGHYSAYYGERLEIRKFAFSRLVPNAEQLTSRLLARGPVPPPVAVSEVTATGAARLAALRALCDRYSVRCIFLIPPELVPSPARAALVQVAVQVGLGVPALEVAAAWTPEYFDSDRFHFSRTGATAYTNHLARLLPQVLAMPDATHNPCCIQSRTMSN
jgi:hypothetical protein